jgi:eukaryotic-like serine/threonine-protein kinase
VRLLLGKSSARDKMNLAQLPCPEVGLRMSDLDANTLANTTVRLGLLTQYQVNEAWDELESRKAPADQFLRCMERKGYLTPYQSSRLVKGETSGYFLGGYRILYKVASGSFGRVFRADDSSSGRSVAIKVLRNKWSENPHKIELFMREGKVGMSLRHPNIVETLAVNQEKRSNQYYIVMEFVEGGNLRDLLTIRKQLKPMEVLRILEDTASGLAHAFSQRITHRDMKLTNILLSSHGPAKLVDFGLAGGAHDEEEVNVDRTVDYAGLEKVTGAPAGDPRSDLFFLGCVAYELLLGQSPLEQSKSQVTRMSAQRFQKIVPLSQSGVEASPSLIRLVDTLMTLDPELRIQTPSQLLERIRECRLEGPGVDLKSTGPIKKTQPTIFLVERDDKLQDVLRAKLKEEGYRVLIAGDAMRALERFRQQPYDLLIVDASTTGDNGYYVFEQIMDEAQRQHISIHGILMLTMEQIHWKERMGDYPAAVTLIQPIQYKQLRQTIKTLLQTEPAS